MDEVSSPGSQAIETHGHSLSRAAKAEDFFVWSFYAHAIGFVGFAPCHGFTGAVRAALPVVYTTTSNLLPNTPDQVVQVYITGTDAIQGENLKL